MIDVHVLRYQPRLDWLETCLSSISTAMARTKLPISLHLVDGVAGHIGEGRAKAYRLGNYPYVTYVDQDDYLLPDALQGLETTLRESPDAIFCSEQTLQNGHFRPGSSRHHLSLFRREQLIDHAAWKVCGDMAQIASVHGTIRDVDSRAYIHRLYESPGRLLRRQHPDEWRAACVQYPVDR